jgi:outer membrane protein assembly factor BamB
MYLKRWTAMSLLLCIGIGPGVCSAEPPSATGDTIPVPSLPTLAWTFPTSAPIVSSPVIRAGRVYFGGFDSALYAIDLHSGNAIWKVPTGGRIRSTPVVTDSVVYFLSGDGRMRAVHAATGAPIWTFATGGEREHDFADYYDSSPTLFRGVLYFGSGDGHVYAVSERDGVLRWKFLTGDVVHARPAVDSSGVFVGSFDGIFYALRLTTGDPVWTFKSVGQRYFPKGEFSGSPTLYGGLIFVGARDYNFYAIDQAGGYCHWNKSFARGWALPNAIADTVLYMGTSDDRLLLAVRPSSGYEYWKVNLGFNIFGGLAAEGTVGYVGTLQGKLYGIDLRTGAVNWTFTTEGYDRNHLEYFKPDDTFRDDIFEIVTSNEAFVDVEHEVGAFFSTPALTAEYLVATSTDGNVYGFRR